MSTHSDTAATADACARAAADRHGLRVAPLHDVAAHHAAAELLRRTWRADSPDAIVSAGLMTAFARSGNYVVGAYRGVELLGVAIGFLGAGHLHSHVTGVDPAAQSRGVGYALKQHQRAWALQRGIAEICWTFDPLVLRNAYFNMHRLGAYPVEYLPDFYGRMVDGVNTGDATDRLYVRWRLDSPEALTLARDSDTDSDTDKGTDKDADRDADEDAEVDRPSAAILVDRLDGDGPVVDGLPTDGRPLLVAVPRDIEEVRGRDAALAARWRHAVREALVPALAAGYLINGISRDGYYILHVKQRS